MVIKNESIFNAKLFMNLANDFQIKEEQEFEKDVENNIDDDCDNNLDDLKDPFFDFLLDDTDNMKKFNYNKGIEEIYQKNDIIYFSNKNNKIIRKKNKKINRLKNYNIKKGDWLCKFCNNINFSFRIKCNICGIGK